MTIDPDAIEVYATSQIREVEARALGGPDPLPLMARAGLALAEVARDRYLSGQGHRILVLAGPGNNGGDALVAARHLRLWWYRVDVVLWADPAMLPGDAARACRDWADAGGVLLADIPADGRWDLAIDGLFGIGLARDLEGEWRSRVARVNALGIPVLAVDIPSGLDSDTGVVRGAAVRAAGTVTFIGLKAGLLTGGGPDHCGNIHLRRLGLEPAAYPAPLARRLTRQRVGQVLVARALDTHKGDYGAVGVLGGAPSMVGAALLAGRAALKAGAGRVYVGLLDARSTGCDPAQPELMLRAPEALFAAPLSVLVAGPGLGSRPDAACFLAEALKTPLPAVLDADALNLLAGDAALRAALATRSVPTVITPHPAEAARLLGTNTAGVQADRYAAARALRETLKCAVVLKGLGSICATTDGGLWVNGTGNPGMASAGMGDVLSGLIGAFIAQGASADDALLLAVHLHGAAADRLAAAGAGPVGMTAGETIDAARALLNRWLYGAEADSGAPSPAKPNSAG